MQRPHVLVYRQGSDSLDAITQELGRSCAVAVSDSLGEGLRRIRDEQVDALCISANSLRSEGLLLEAGGVLTIHPDGILLLNDQASVVWCNAAASAMLDIAKLDIPGSTEAAPDRTFSHLLGVDAQFIGPDFSPLNTALGSGDRSRTVIRRGEKQYLEATFVPVREPSFEFPQLVLVALREVSQETLQQQKLNAIIQAGVDLGDLRPKDVVDLTLEERVDLLKSKLLHFIQELLEFDTVEIRLLEPDTERLIPLLAVGMQPEAAARGLFARVEGNGVTGFVGATGRSYLCEDTSKDPLYLPGAEGAKCSLTVALKLHEQVLGTFNVESPRIGAFSAVDLNNLELFARSVAIAINTLNLLVVEQAKVLVENRERVLCQVADPVDEILNDACWMLEKYSHEPALQERLRKILEHTQEIRQQIRTTGEAVPVGQVKNVLPIQHPLLRAKRILVADSDRDIRRSAHEILGRFGCIIETAHDGDEALRMARTFSYDVVLADILLPDLPGSRIYFGLKQIRSEMPVILTTGFGHDKEHAIVKARQHGMKRALYKPFRTHLLVAALEELFAPAPGNTSPMIAHA